MQISIVGTGYVGLVAGAVFSNKGFDVYCIDIDEAKIKLLSNGGVPIHEPLLKEQIEQGLAKGSLHFTNKYDCIKNAEAIFLAVGTPDMPDGSANLTYLYQAIDEIIKVITEKAILVVKSTVPPGTCDQIQQHVASLDLKNDVVMNPEFLKQGNAVNDFLSPDRIVIGCKSLLAQEKMAAIYKSWHTAHKIFTDYATAELIKYAANSFLATKIAFINEMANLCDYFGSDINKLSLALGLDDRIGNQFLKAGPGFGGSCFPKDLGALLRVTKEKGIENHILKAVIDSNNSRRNLMVKKIESIVGDVKDKYICALGLSFKAGTDDIRFSPAIKILQILSQRKAYIKVFDPAAMDNTASLLSDIIYSNNPMDAVIGAECLIILTEWDEFTSLDFEKIFQKMKKPIIIDLRNLLDPAKIRNIGFEYHGL